MNSPRGNQAFVIASVAWAMAVVSSNGELLKETDRILVVEVASDWASRRAERNRATSRYEIQLIGFWPEP